MSKFVLKADLVKSWEHLRSFTGDTLLTQLKLWAKMRFTSDYHPPCVLKTSHHQGVYQLGHQREGWLWDAEKQNLITTNNIFNCEFPPRWRSIRHLFPHSCPGWQQCRCWGRRPVHLWCPPSDPGTWGQRSSDPRRRTHTTQHHPPAENVWGRTGEDGEGARDKCLYSIQRSRRGWWENEWSSSTDFKHEAAIIKATTYLTGVIKVSSDFREACNWSTAALHRVSRSLHRSVAQELLYINLISANGFTRPQSMIEQDGADRSRVCAVMKH